MQLLRDTTPRARKVHKCHACRISIKPGEQYRRSTYVNDGNLYDWISCLACEAISGRVHSWASTLFYDEGVGREDYHEWAMERLSHDADRADAEAYLNREGYVTSHHYVGVYGHPDDPECTYTPEDNAAQCGEEDWRHVYNDN